MKTSVRPPTKRMIEKLKECREKEIAGNGSIPCFPEEMKLSLAGLYKRGFIDTRMDIVNNKKQLCIYVTQAGNNFLKKMESTVV